MIRWARTAVAVAAAIALVGCGKGPLTQSHGDTTTSGPVGKPMDAKEIDSLVVPMDQIPGVGDSLRHSTVNKQPSTSQPADHGPNPGSPCTLANLAPDDIAIFGNNPITFRSVNYSGFSNVDVIQAIGIYADTSDAGAVFQHLTTRLKPCQSEGGETSVDSISPTSATWHERGFSPVKGADETSSATNARVVKNVVFCVTAGHFDNAEQIASSVADQIADKINKPV